MNKRLSKAIREYSKEMMNKARINLTAERHMFEDMDASFRRSFCVSHLELMSKDQKVAYETFKAGWISASQVVNKLAEELRKLREACEPFRNAFAEHGAYQYNGVTPEIASIIDQNVITPRGVNMGDFRRLYEALAATDPTS